MWWSFYGREFTLRDQKRKRVLARLPGMWWSFYGREFTLRDQKRKKSIGEIARYVVS